MTTPNCCRSRRRAEAAASPEQSAIGLLRSREPTIRSGSVQVTETPATSAAASSNEAYQGVAQMKTAFPRATGLHEQAKTAGATNVAKIREAGFDVIPDPTKKFPNHGRVVHPQGAQGFNDENLARRSQAFKNKEGTR
jgi:hypothetical protein